MKPYVVKQSESAVPAGAILLVQKQVYFFELTPCDVCQVHVLGETDSTSASARGTTVVKG